MGVSICVYIIGFLFNLGLKLQSSSLLFEVVSSC